MTYVILALATVALSLIGPTPAAAAGPLTNRCTNDEYGFSVSYPQDWFTNDPAEVLDSHVSDCALFAPFDDIAVYAEATNVPIFLKHQSTGADGGTPVTLDGLPGTVVDTESSGINGDAWHTYYVPLDDDSVFVAFAFDNGTAPFGESVAILDAMMATVDLNGDGLPNVAMPSPGASLPAAALRSVGILILAAAAVAVWKRRTALPA